MALRGQAKFCPQCGAVMDGSPAAAKTAPGTAAEPAAPTTADESPAPDAYKHTRVFSGEERLSLSDELARQRARVKEADEHYAATALPPNQQQKVDLRAVAAQVWAEMQAKERARAEQERAQAGQVQTQSEPARVPGTPVRVRSQRPHEASVGWLDKAQDDPALRFVLLALVLFVLFLLILLFSYILG